MRGLQAVAPCTISDAAAVPSHRKSRQCREAHKRSETWPLVGVSARRTHRTRSVGIRRGVLALLLSACAADSVEQQRDRRRLTAPAVPAEAAAFGYERVPADKEGQLRLVAISTTVLGRTTDETPVDVRSIAETPDAIYILDAKGRRIRSYNKRGALRFATGRWGRAEGEFDTPTDLRIHHDTIVVLDLSHDDHVKLYSFDGAYLGARVFPLEEGGTSFEILDGGMFVNTLQGRRQGGRVHTMMALDPTGRVKWLGCDRDPQYDEGERLGSASARYAFRALARRGGRLFCVQPLTPVVQIFDTLGRYLGSSRRAPAEYLPAPLTPQTLNAVETQQFESRWTAHLAMYPTTTGFISVYATWDQTAGDNRYLLFSCDSATFAVRCASTWSPGQPVALVGDDTLLIVSEHAGGPLRLTRYKVGLAR